MKLPALAILAPTALVLTALALIAPLPMAQAEMLDRLDRVETPVGLLEVVPSPDGFGESLRLGDRLFLEDGLYAYASIIAREGALYLIELSTGGTACAAEYAWFHAVPGDLRLSPVFGNCSDLAAVTADAKTVTVILPALEASVGRVAFVYDGEAVTERPVGQVPSGSPPEEGAEAWIGRYPFELFRAADWRAPLVDLLGEGDYALAGELIALSAPMEVQGNWIVGSGCVKFDCQSRFGAVAIHRGDGRLLVALRDGERSVVRGDSQGPLPPGIAAVVE